MFQYRRTTNASRRAERTIRYLHVSKDYTWIAGKTMSEPGRYVPLAGETFNKGRNAAKRARAGR